MQKNSEYIVITDALLTEKGFVTDRAVRIKDGIITDITDRDEIHTSENVLDFSRYSIAPCFCDHHLHFFQKDKEELSGIIDDLTSCGIKAVCDGGDPFGHGMKIKNSERDRLGVKTAGYALYEKGSYGSYIGQEVGSLQEAEDIINRLAHENVDYIKVINSGVFKPAEGRISSGGFTCNELKHIVACAGAKGLPVTCHANGDEAVRMAIEAGVSSIVHGLGTSAESLALMAEKEVSFIPTVNAFARLGVMVSEKRALENIQNAVTQHLETVGKASALGVNVLPGSDAGAAVIPYGSSFLRELDLFEKAGMSSENILLSAAAEVLKQGAKADFLIVDGLNVKQVCRGGRIY